MEKNELSEKLKELRKCIDEIGKFGFLVDSISVFLAENDIAEMADLDIKIDALINHTMIINTAAVIPKGWEHYGYKKIYPEDTPDGGNVDPHMARVIRRVKS